MYPFAYDKNYLQSNLLWVTS